MRKFKTNFIGILLGFAAASVSHAKTKPSPLPEPESRKGILLEPFESAQLELPGGGEMALGPDLQAHLAGKLTLSGNYWVVEENRLPIAAKFPLPLISKRAPARQPSAPPEWVWNGSNPESLRVRLKIQSFLFQTGERGERAAYGFDSRSPRVPNDFPLKSNEASRLTGASYFGNAFDPIAESEWKTYAGLDLGQGLGLDVLYAFLKLKLARFVLKSKAVLELEDVASHARVSHELLLETTGFHFDLTGGYAGFSGGIAVAREDVLRRASKSMSEQVLPRIGDAAALTRHRGILDAILPAVPGRELTLLLGTGLDSQIRKGVIFESQNQTHRLEVQQSVESGSVMRLVAGDPATLQVGMEFIEVREPDPSALARALRLVSKTSASSSENLSNDVGTLSAPIKLSSEYWADSVIGRAFLDFLSGNVLLPYRIYRFAKTDQKVLREPDHVAKRQPHALLETWQREVARSRSGKTLGFTADETPESADTRSRDGSRPLIAVIDTGIDYNQPILHPRLYRRPDATLDEFARGNRFGWDFSSGDAQPYDEHGRGTAMASVIAAAAPGASILALKSFNPWGVTTTAQLVNAIRMSVSAGAQIVVLGWSTPVQSFSLKQAIQEATENGVLVVAAAGDQGVSLEIAPEYPAAWSKEIPGLLTVAALTGRGDWLYQEGRKGSSYSPRLVQLGVPAEEVPILKPRGRKALASGSALAAAWVAGAAARLPQTWSGVKRQEWLLDHAKAQVGRLDRVIERGRVLDWRSVEAFQPEGPQ